MIRSLRSLLLRTMGVSSHSSGHRIEVAYFAALPPPSLPSLVIVGETQAHLDIG